VGDRSAQVRTGQGWDEGIMGDVLREASHVYSEHVKRALGLTLLSRKF
jgi:hypothetical protein